MDQKLGMEGKEDRPGHESDSYRLNCALSPSSYIEAWTPSVAEFEKGSLRK